MLFGFLYRFLKPKLFLFLFLSIVLFACFAKIDIVISRFFFVNQEFIGWNWYVKGFNGILIKIIICLLIIISVYNLSISYYQKKGIIKHILYIIVLLAGMHLFVIHSLTKNVFGRARPQQIIEFGGQKTFSSAFYISDQCQKNCSFVSGDVSIAFSLFGLVLAIPIGGVVTKKRKSIILDCAFLIGIIMCFCRLSLGKHFLSDVFLAMLITIIGSFYFYRLIFGKVEYKDLENNL